MCGISVVLDSGTPATPLLATLARLHADHAHRGPDGEGALLVAADPEWIERLARVPGTRDGPPPVLGAAFRRLAIQDRSEAGAQPMTLAGSGARSWILFNGELYNHQELRTVLSREGLAVRSGSDAEIALAAWRHWGPDAVQRFNGMFAFVIVDLDRGEVVGARDRLGIKPLFWSRDGARLLIGSEPAPVAAARSGGARLEASMLASFLGGVPPLVNRASWFADVYPFPAASTFRIPIWGPPSKPEFRRYWTLPSHGPIPGYQDAVIELRSLLQDAVRLQSCGDVPVGSLLSGGLDSSYLTCELARTRAEPVDAFSIVHTDPRLSETPHQWGVIARTHARHHAHTMTPDALAAATDAVVAVQGQPLLGFEIVAQHAIYGVARAAGVPVVLDGQGADELLAGQSVFAQAWLRQLAAEGRLVELWKESRALARASGSGHGMRSLLRALGPARGASVPRLPHVNPAAAREAARSWNFDVPSLPALLRRLVLETNIPSVLELQDRSSMAHGVESRVPFLDHRVVEFCDRLPAEYRLHRGVRKRILRDAARGLVPDGIIDRQDKGTIVSSTRYLDLRRTHATALRAMATAPMWEGVPAVRASAIAPFVDGFLTGAHDKYLAVWRLYTAWRWLSLPPLAV